MKRLLVLLAAILFGAAALSAQNVECKTYTYANRGDVALQLDLYATSTEVQPCIIYVFGGAFLAGSRDQKGVIEVYEYFARRGWKVVAIDYRLGLRPLVEQPTVKRNVLDIRSMLIDAVGVATEDLLEATAYLVANAEQLGIDSKKIVTLGSSAGAITALQAEWELCNGGENATLLPSDFNYAGVISMAGAILAPGRKLKWERTPCPIMLFHGNADKNVPYGRQTLFGVSLFGSECVAKSLTKSDIPHWFYDAKNVGHRLSWRPMYEQRIEMEQFLERLVLGGEKTMIHHFVDDCTLPDVGGNFGLKTYIQANFAAPRNELSIIND